MSIFFVLVELLQRRFHSPSLSPGAAAGMCSRLWSVGMESPWAWGWRTFTEYLAVMIDGAPLDPLLMNVHANTERLHRCRGAALLHMWRRFRGQQRLGGCKGGGGVNQITAGPGPGPGSESRPHSCGCNIWMKLLEQQPPRPSRLTWGWSCCPSGGGLEMLAWRSCLFCANYLKSFKVGAATD